MRVYTHGSFDGACFEHSGDAVWPTSQDIEPAGAVADHEVGGSGVAAPRPAPAPPPQRVQEGHPKSSKIVRDRLLGPQKMPERAHGRAIKPQESLKLAYAGARKDLRRHLDCPKTVPRDPPDGDGISTAAKWSQETLQVKT